MTEVLIDRDRLAARVLELAGEIHASAPSDAPLHLVAVLNGAFIFLADLVRALPRPTTCDFLAVTSYAGQSSSGEVRLTKDLDRSIEGRDVLIVEDIVESGLTLSYLQRLLRARGPRSLRTVCLLDKRSRRAVAVDIDHVGFIIPDRFVVGYGLDLDGHYRHLPDIRVLVPATASIVISHTLVNDV